MPKPLVLFLAANPKGTTSLSLDAECRAIAQEITMSLGRLEIDFQTRWAVTVDDLMRELNTLSPVIVHFSGHGSAQGVCLVDDHGLPQLVAPDKLADLIESTETRARAVVLNACYTDQQAEVFAKTLGCAVGMRGGISDGAAREFSMAFYRALGNGKSLFTAYRQASAALAAKGLDERARPQCKTREGVEASEIRLVKKPGTAPSSSRPVPAKAEPASTTNFSTTIGTINQGSQSEVSIGGRDK